MIFLPTEFLYDPCTAGAVNTLSNISMCIGTALSGVLYEFTGFYGVYYIALAMYSVSLIYGYFRIEDTCTKSPDKRIESNGFCRLVH